MGNITATVDGVGNRMGYIPDKWGRVTEIRETYDYDVDNRLCRMRDRNGTETLYTYNMYGNLLERRAKAPTADISEPSECYEYTAEGLLKSAISRSGTGDAAIGMRYSYAYDRMGRLEKKSASGRTLLAFAYDLNGNLTRQTDVTGKTTEYRYDADRSLTSLRTTLGSEVLADNHYCYDGNGRRVEKRQIRGLTTYTYDSMNRLSMKRATC